MTVFLKLIQAMGTEEGIQANCFWRGITAPFEAMVLFAMFFKEAALAVLLAMFGGIMQALGYVSDFSDIPTPAQLDECGVL